MAITVREQIDGREAEFETGGKGNEGVQRRYTRRFQVTLDTWGSNGQDLIDAVLATGIPRLGDPFTTGRHTDLGSRCFSVVPSATEEPRVFLVTAQYSNQPSDFGEPEKEVGNAANEPGQNENKPSDPNNPNSQEGDDPLSRPAEIEWGEGQYSEVIHKATLVTAGVAAANTTAVCNSAGEPFDPPLEIERTFLTLRITRNQANFDQNKAQSFKSQMNSDTFFGFEAGKCKCKSITATNQYEKGRHFWRVTYFFEIRDSWDYEILDAGYWELVGGERVEIKFPNGRPLSAPWPLDGAGAKLTVAQVQAGNAMQYRTYRVGEQKGFAGLNLP